MRAVKLAFTSKEKQKPRQFPTDYDLFSYSNQISQHCNGTMQTVQSDWPAMQGTFPG